MQNKSVPQMDLHYRSDLVEHLLVCRSVVTVVAPAGFGKSTLLRQVATAGEARSSIVVYISSFDTSADADLEGYEPNSVLALVDEANRHVGAIERWIDHPAIRGMVVADRSIQPELHECIAPYEVESVTEAELRFTHDDIVAYAAARIAGDVTQIAHLVRAATEGWPDAVDFVVQRLAKAHDPLRAAQALTGKGPYFEELLQRYLDRLDPVMGSAVEQLAHLNRFTVRCVAVLTGGANIGGALSAGVPLLENGNGWYRLPQSICQPIRNASSLSETAAVALAPALLASGGVVAGSRLLIEAGRTKQAVNSLDTLSDDQVDDANQIELLSLLKLLDQAEPKNQRLLLLIARVCRNLGRLAEWGRCLERVIEVAEESSPETIEAQLDLLYARVFGQSDLVKKELDALVAQIPELSAKQRTQADEIRGCVAAQNPNPAVVRQAVADLQEVATRWEHLGQPGRSASTLRMMSAAALVHLGEYDMAQTVLRRARGLAWNRTFDRALTSVLACRIDALAGDLAELEFRVEEARALASALNLDWAKGYLDWTAMWHHARSGRPAEAHKSFESAAAHLGELLEQETGAIFRCEAAIAFAECGMVSEAKEQVQVAATNAAANPVEVAVASTVVAARSGDLAAVETLTASSLALPDMPVSRVWRFHLEAAVAQFLTSDADAAQKSSARALAEAEEIGLKTLAEQLLAPTRPQVAGQSPAQSPDQIFIVTLGGFNVFRDSALIQLSKGHVTSLVKLLATVGAPCAADQIVDFLWPEVDIEIGNRRLKNVLSRVKGELGEGVIVRRGGALVLAEPVEVDIRSLDRLVREASRTGADESECLRQLVAALDLYQGPLLPSDLYADQFILARENAKAQAASALDLIFDLGPSVRPNAVWLLNTLLRVDPEDDQRLIRIARQALAENHMACAKQALNRAARVTQDLGVDIAAEIDDLQFLLDAESKLKA